jgi:hypothetical protein
MCDISTFVSKDAFVFCIATVKVANHSNCGILSFDRILLKIQILSEKGII